MHIDLQSYQPLAMRTAKQMGTQREQLLHGALGCCTEPGELALTIAAWSANPLTSPDLKNVVEELGDGMWFAAYVADAMGATLHDITSQFEQTPVETESIGELALRYCAAGADIGTLIKAHAFYGKELVRDQLLNTLSLYVNLSGQICMAFGIPGIDVLAANIDKLSKRYPDKYSDQAAIARADKVEDPTGEEVSDTASMVGLVDRTVTEDGSPSSVDPQ